MSRAAILALATVAVFGFAVPGAAVDGDITLHRAAGADQGTPPAVFPHWAHRIRFKCYVCHDAIFQMKAGSNPVTMDDIRAGKFCGVCHNGKIAFAVGFETCARCHRE